MLVLRGISVNVVSILRLQMDIDPVPLLRTPYYTRSGQYCAEARMPAIDGVSPAPPPFTRRTVQVLGPGQNQGPASACDDRHSMIVEPFSGKLFELI